MEAYCAYCYTTAVHLLKCGKCKKRLFCSKECQRQDWKVGHRVYCGKSGELGFDFEIRQVHGIGLGAFALRSFQKNDKIMVERPLLKFPSVPTAFPDQREVPPSAESAVASLAPIDGSFMEKLLTNGMSCSPLGDIGETGLFVTMSRMYHECLANADHQYLENRGVKIVVAARSISPGEQITIAYVTGSNPGRRMKLQSQYGFVCHCRACSYASIEAKLTKAIRLDSAILDAGSMGQTHMALQKGRAPLSIYDDLGISDWLYMRTYHDLYQVTITKRKYLRDGRHYTSKAYEAVLAYTGDAEHPEVTRLKTLVADPSSHRNYLLVEGK